MLRSPLCGYRYSMSTSLNDSSTRNDSTGAAGVGSWLVWGAMSGFVAGVAFIALTAWFTTSMGNPQLTPFRVVATLAQGPPPPEATIWIGMVIHSILSALFGLLFAVAMAGLRTGPGGRLVWAGIIYGGIVYLVDFQVLARYVTQFSAFQDVNQPFELTVHLVFGAALAALLLAWPMRARARR